MFIEIAIPQETGKAHLWATDISLLTEMGQWDWSRRFYKHCVAPRL